MVQDGRFKWTSILGIVIMIAVGMTSIEGRPLDATDICLMSCDTCYKGETLLHCANECISTDGAVSAAWTQTCPTFIGNENFSHRMKMAAEGFQKRTL